MKLFDKTATELSALIRKKEVKPSEVLKSFLSRYDETKELNAFISLNQEFLLEQAAEYDKAPITADTHPLFGIPVAIKDNIATKDQPTTCASKMLEGFVPPYDAEVVERLRRAGALIYGKTNLDEFAMGSTGQTSYFGAANNPKYPGCIPGGSSSGSAAAVASGSVPLALGSDTGGSIRLPAAFCGIVGYKPSYGAVSRNGLFAYAGSLDQIGPMAKTVDDAALLASAISFSFMPEAIKEYRLKGRRIGVIKECFCENIARHVEALKKLGAEVFEVSIPLIAQCSSVYPIIAFSEASSNLSLYDGVRFGYRSENSSNIESLYVNSRTEGFGDVVRRRIWLGTYMLSAGKYDKYYKKARIALDMLRDEFDKAFETCDALISPVSALEKPPAGHEPEGVNDAFTIPVNMAGLPAIAIGNLQFIGKRFDDEALLGFARDYEQTGGGTL